jgi:acyl carrier protein
MEIRTSIRRFVLKRFMFGAPAEGLKDEMSFLEQGVVDSTGVLELVAFLEETFKLKIDDEELVPENLDSVSKLVRFISEKIAHAA